MSKAADDRLARRGAAGDERALAAIYRRYHQDLYRYCLSIVGNSEDAQDALQNAMVKVLRALPGEKRRIELRPWLYRIAHNESVELLRRRRPSEQLEPEQAAPRGADLAEDVAVRERLRRLVADLEQLPERQRGALVMRELSGLGYEEIATALGTSPAVARQALYEARLNLRRIEAGREMDCDAVTRALSDADGRVTRRRDVRAHLRACSDCRRFKAEIEDRRGDLAALAPLPAVAAAGLLQGLLGGAAGSGAGGAAGAGAAGAAGGAAAKSLGAAAALKSAAAVAVVAAVGIGAADRAGVVDVAPFGGDGDRSQRLRSDEAPPSAASAAAAAQAAAPAFERAREASRAAAALRGAGALAGLPGAAALGRHDSGAADRDGGDPTGPAGAPVGAGSHPHGRGHEKQHPDAAAHGQQTAASHKATGKGGGNGGGRSGGGSGQSKSASAAKPVKPPKSAAAPGSPQAGEPPKSPQAKAPKSPPASEPAGGAAAGPKKESAAAGVPPVESPASAGPEEAPDKGRGPAFHP